MGGQYLNRSFFFVEKENNAILLSVFTEKDDEAILFSVLTCFSVFKFYFGQKIFPFWLSQCPIPSKKSMEWFWFTYINKKNISRVFKSPLLTIEQFNINIPSQHIIYCRLQWWFESWFFDIWNIEIS